MRFSRHVANVLTRPLQVSFIPVQSGGGHNARNKMLGQLLANQQWRHASWYYPDSRAQHGVEHRCGLSKDPDGQRRGRSEQYLSIESLIPALILHLKPLFTHCIVNKEILPCFSEKWSTIFQHNVFYYSLIYILCIPVSCVISVRVDPYQALPLASPTPYNSTLLYPVLTYQEYVNFMIGPHT